MIHVVTVHHRSEQWIDVQASYLSRHLSEPYTTWANLEGVEHRASSFDHVVPAGGGHAGKLNLIAAEVATCAPPDDLIMFLDGDAFPIVDPMPVVREALSAADLVAVRRAENVDEPQPHPCFAVTTVGTWSAIHGDWAAGHQWRGPHGRVVSDVGGNLLRLLELHGKRWHALLRSNRVDLHPLWYGIYGDVVYHHGAGFRANAVSRWDRRDEPRPLLPRLAELGWLGRPVDRVNAHRSRAWERRVAAQRTAQSEAIYQALSTDPEFYKRFL